MHPFEHLKARGDVRPCCLNLERNLHVEEVNDKAYRATCRECGRRHYLMKAEKFEIGGALAALSSRDKKLALHPHARGDGGPTPGRKIILP